jgi:hypothetical protein
MAGSNTMTNRAMSELTGRRLVEMVAALYEADPGRLTHTTAEEWDIILHELARGDHPGDIADRIDRARYERRGVLHLWEAREARKQQAKRGPTADAIRAKFRARAKKLHPDAGGDAEAFRKLVAERDRALGRMSTRSVRQATSVKEH